MKKLILIFSGYNQRAVIAFLRTLETCKLQYVIVAKDSGDNIFNTKYGKSVVYTRTKKELNLDEIIKCFKLVKKKEKAETLFISPSTEALNRFLLQHREIFESMGCQIPLVSEKLYAKISDKISFGKMCRDSGLKVPREIPIDEVTDFPVVIKPRTYRTATGVYNASPDILYNRRTLNEFIEKNGIQNYYIEEFVRGESYYLLYYFWKDGRIDKLSQRNLLQQPNGKSIVAAEVTDIHNTEISSEYESLLKKNGFRGLCMVEVRKCGNNWYMIEANPRFWGPSQLFINAGRNLFLSFLADYGLYDNEVHFGNLKWGARYFWNGGVWETKNGGKSLVVLSSDSFDEDWIKFDVYRHEDTWQLFEDKN